jgi:DNA-3-methyladenine glycosylase
MNNLLNDGQLLLSDFYAQPAAVVARALLGSILVRAEAGLPVIRGRVVETEAYTGLNDLASHGRSRQTPRNLPMWGPPGFAYVYLSRGLHWMFNVVTEPEGQPAAVLIRAIEPLEGESLIAQRRSAVKPLDWARGPGRLTRALNITGALNRANLTTPESGLWLQAGPALDEAFVKTSPRVGLGKTPEPWLSIHWRWYVADSPWVSARQYNNRTG